MLTIDASALVDALIDGSQRGHALRVRLRHDGPLFAPELIDLEVVSVLRRLTRDSRLTGATARAALDDLAQLPVRRLPHRLLTERIWEIRDNAVPYDAAYIATAELTGTTLLTADRKLAGIPGVRCAVDIVR